MITIFIDNKPHQVKPGQNLLQACLSLGFDLPYFCWHPAMHSVGACRQCAVKQFKDEKDTRGRIVMSCMTPLSEGMRVSVDDPEAKAFRAGITEFLMKNHPHDCPVCDEGGECHLQDMTVMTGHTYRRTRFKKRTHRNQDLGPLINHEMNRCIACYRCVRFYRGIAGGRDLNVFASHDHVYFGRHEDGVLESEFSGNLVEICPTGVFTDKTFKRHYTRKWDLQTAPSICVHCGLGCNTIAGERYGTLRRILNRFNHEVNGYFLCDRGRFGYEFVNSEKRIRQPLASPSLNPSHQGRDDNKSSSPLVGEDRRRGVNEEAQPVSKDIALLHISDVLSRSKGIIGIGSPRASLESNYALRTLVGQDNFYSGMSGPDHKLVSLIIDILQKGPARTPSLHDVHMADAVLILGEDVSNTAPLLDLALRQAVRNKPKEKTAAMRIPEWDDNAIRNAIQNETGPLFIATITNTRLDAFATRTYRATPDDIARLGFAIAHELDPDAPHLPPLPVGERTEVRGDVDVMPLAREIAQALKNARQPLIISGTSMGNEPIIQAAANIAWALCESGKPAELCYVVPGCNSLGAGLLGGKNIDELLLTPSTLRGEGRGEGIETIIILENDLYRRADQRSVDEFMNKAKYVIVIDQLINSTSSRADITLPAATFAESDGTLVNNEGRAQRYYQVFQPEGNIQASWKWINDIMKSLGNPAAGGLQSFDDLINDMASALPHLAAIKDIAPSADFRIIGQKIPRQPHRYSGRTAMLADVSVHEPKPPADPDTPLAFSMEGYQDQPPAPLISRYWSPGWNSVQALNKFQQEVGGPLKSGDPGKRLIEPVTLPSSLPSREGLGPHRPESNTSSPLAGEDRGEGDKDVRGNSGKITFFKYIPEAAKPNADEQIDRQLRDSLSLEELSSYSPAIVERAKLMLLTKKRDAMTDTIRQIIILFSILFVVLTIGSMLIWLERRLLALWQDRYGPNRVGPFGLLQVLADSIKIFAKEDWVPPFADKAVFILAPAVIMVVVLMSFTVIPFAPGIEVVDLNIGLLFFLAMSSMGVYSVALAGWASNSKYSLLGGLRSVAQMLSYEVFMGLSLMGVVMLAGSFNLREIVEAQRGGWFIIPQFIGFVVFFIAGIAETHRLPFDLPEAESELVAGFHAEYSGMKFGMFFIGEYLAITLISALTVTLFFGGWLGPLLPPVVWFGIKTFVFICFFILLRASLPRPRYDQLMSFGWKVMLPLSLANLVVTGAIILAQAK